MFLGNQIGNQMVKELDLKDEDENTAIDTQFQPF